MRVKALLDDAAAEATVGLRIDLAAARRQADERRALIRRRASAAMVAAVTVAAVATLMAVLLPGGLFRAEPAPAATPPDRPIGLPDHWYYAPPWTPPVTHHPMAAASMVLAESLQTGWSTWPIDGPVLVSADGRSYASLPWSKWDTDVALSADGREVAWVTQRDDRGGPDPAVVHRIRLSDGVQHDVPLPKREVVQRLAWDGGRLLIGVVSPGKGLRMRELAAGSDSLQPGGPLPAALTGGSVGGDNPEIRGDRMISTSNGPDLGAGRRAEIISKEAAGHDVSSELDVSRPTKVVKIPITGTDPTTDAKILGWAEGGIVVRMQSRDREDDNHAISLRLYDPDRGTYRVITRPGTSWGDPVAIAVDVVGSGRPVPGVQPQFAGSDRRHLQYLIVQGWIAYRSRIVLGAIGLAGLVGALLWRRRRRRAPKAVASAGEDAVVVAGEGTAGK